MNSCPASTNTTYYQQLNDTCNYCNYSVVTEYANWTAYDLYNGTCGNRTRQAWQWDANYFTCGNVTQLASDYFAFNVTDYDNINYYGNYTYNETETLACSPSIVLGENKMIEIAILLVGIVFFIMWWSRNLSSKHTVIKMFADIVAFILVILIAHSAVVIARAGDVSTLAMTVSRFYWVILVGFVVIAIYFMIYWVKSVLEKTAGMTK